MIKGKILKKLLIALTLSIGNALAMQHADNIHPEAVFEFSYFTSADDKEKSTRPEVDHPQYILTESFVLESPFTPPVAQPTPQEAAAKVLGLRSSLTFVPVLAPATEKGYTKNVETVLAETPRK